MTQPQEQQRPPSPVVRSPLNPERFRVVCISEKSEFIKGDIYEASEFVNGKIEVYWTDPELGLEYFKAEPREWHCPVAMFTPTLAAELGVIARTEEPAHVNNEIVCSGPAPMIFQIPLTPDLDKGGFKPMWEDSPLGKIRAFGVTPKLPPPRGIKPEFRHREQRAIDILQAMVRFLAAGKPIPKDWRVELDDNLYWLEIRNASLPQAARTEKDGSTEGVPF